MTLLRALPILFLLVAPALAAPPRQLALLAGGSGEPPGEALKDNFFVQDLKEYRSRLIARGWQVRVVLGARAGLLPGSRPATNANLRQAITNLLAKAQPGDHVLLLFHSHGREPESQWGQQSHSLVSEDRDASGVDPGFNLDAIEPWLNAAKARGVVIGLVDLSCYSGNTQALEGASCTVSLAAPHYVSICSGRAEERAFNSHFFQLPSPGPPISLEAQFLRAREADQNSINLPQISSRPTPALEQWDQLLTGLDPLDLTEDLKNYRAGAPPYDPKPLLQAIQASPAAPALKSRIAHTVEEMIKKRGELEKRMPDLARDLDERTLALHLPHEKKARKVSPGMLAELLEKIPLDDLQPLLRHDRSRRT